VILIDSDSTRHYLVSRPGNVTTTYQTNDGSHITLSALRPAARFITTAA
jgi:hypothetical protein